MGCLSFSCTPSLYRVLLFLILLLFVVLLLLLLLLHLFHLLLLLLLLLHYFFLLLPLTLYYYYGVLHFHSVASKNKVPDSQCMNDNHTERNTAQTCSLSHSLSFSLCLLFGPISSLSLSLVDLLFLLSCNSPSPSASPVLCISSRSSIPGAFLSRSLLAPITLVSTVSLLFPTCSLAPRLLPPFLSFSFSRYICVYVYICIYMCVYMYVCMYMCVVLSCKRVKSRFACCASNYWCSV